MVVPSLFLTSLVSLLMLPEITLVISHNLFLLCCITAFSALVSRILKNPFLVFQALFLASLFNFLYLDVRPLYLACSLHPFISLKHWLAPCLFQSRLVIAKIVIHKFKGGEHVLYSASNHRFILHSSLWGFAAYILWTFSISFSLSAMLSLFLALIVISFISSVLAISLASFSSFVVSSLNWCLVKEIRVMSGLYSLQSSSTV